MRRAGGQKRGTIISFSCFRSSRIAIQIPDIGVDCSLKARAIESPNSGGKFMGAESNRRRQFLIAAGGLVAAPLAHAQLARRILWLSVLTEAAGSR